MSRTLVLITGASRGFGGALALQFAKSPLARSQPTDFVITARDEQGLAATKSLILEQQRSSEGTAKAGEGGVALTAKSILTDFSRLDLEAVSDEVLRGLPRPPTDYSQAYLFNNAGSLGKLARFSTLTAADMTSALHLNVTAPMVLTAAFLRHFASSGTKLSIINISSLAAIQAFDCWSLYCVGKAARDMMHSAIATEQPDVRVLNYAPGPLDTDMQTAIREEMPDVPTRSVFINMHEEKKLVAPEVSSRVLFHLLEKDEFKNGSHADIYDVEGWERFQ
ncbi:uncharacterized protein EV422DRAFT_42299 [Fimicolochytrium jonesii]|uniref:uncharacterized protein n=1 Tax=Fimicolochytrium jonesii TaxID=1396493 RepID=UPI0022FEA91C|nr:uncharacterized protein EV422DRAFT_42299 [Fimicolochytrium jonesii]KAI8821430.1 hypothetical protein EV422DRAFT_42299 [Fimicolochytrium jonesii]